MRPRSVGRGSTIKNGFDQSASGSRSKERVTSSDNTDGVEHPLWWCVLQQKAAGTGLKCRVNVLIKIKCGEDENSYADQIAGRQ